MSIYPRTEYEMTEDDLAKILGASKPVPYMVVGDCPPSSPQENANRSWRELGERMGFDWQTVRPVQGKGQRFFTAVPSETPGQRKEREASEEAQRRSIRRAEIRSEIETLQEELGKLGGAEVQP